MLSFLTEQWPQWSTFRIRCKAVEKERIVKDCGQIHPELSSSSAFFFFFCSPKYDSDHFWLHSKSKFGSRIRNKDRSYTKHKSEIGEIKYKRVELKLSETKI